MTARSRETALRLWKLLWGVFTFRSFVFTQGYLCQRVKKSYLPVWCRNTPSVRRLTAVALRNTPAGVVPRACVRVKNPHAPTLAACAAQGKLHFPCDSLCCLPFCASMKRNTLLRQSVPFHGAEFRGLEVNRYRNLSLRHQDYQPGKRQVSRCSSRLPKRRENHKRVGRHDP